MTGDLPCRLGAGVCAAIVVRKKLADVLQPLAEAAAEGAQCVGRHGITFTCRSARSRAALVSILGDRLALMSVERIAAVSRGHEGVLRTAHPQSGALDARVSNIRKRSAAGRLR